MTIVDEGAGLFDEFGNYIGPERPENASAAGLAKPPGLDDESNWTDDDMAVRDQDQERSGRTRELSAEGLDRQMALAQLHGVPPTSRSLLLAEERSPYPSSLQVYGPRVQTLVERVDRQPASQPIVVPLKHKRIQLRERMPPGLPYTADDLAGTDPRFIRNVAVVGALHHGKTGLLDILVRATHTLDTSHVHAKELRRQQDEQLPLNYTDSYFAEHLRKISLVGKCLTVRYGPHVLNLLDTPGHTDFTDEAVCQLRLCDGIVLVVDIVEGLLLQTERLLRLAVAAALPVVLVLNKLDRLVLELAIPPADAFLKLQLVVAQLNAVAGAGYFSPPRGNVLFGSTRFGWLFSLSSWTRYRLGHRLHDQPAFLRGLWSRKCVAQAGRLQKAPSPVLPRAFVTLVLEPLYKLHAHVVGAGDVQLKELCRSLGIRLSGTQRAQNLRPLLATVMGKVLRWSAADVLVGAVGLLVPSPIDAAPLIAAHYVVGGEASAQEFPSSSGGAQELPSSIGAADLNAAGIARPDASRPTARPDASRPTATPSCASPMSIRRAMLEADALGPLVAFAARLYAQPIDPHKTEPVALVRVYSGTLQAGTAVRMLGPAFRADDPREDSAVLRVQRVLFSGGGRYELEPTMLVGPGSIVLVHGIGRAMGAAGATLVDPSFPAPAILRPLRWHQPPLVRVALEPLALDRLPLLLETLDKLARLYPSLRVRAEPGGGHVLMGPGELFLDCVLHDLRCTLAHDRDDDTRALEVRLAEPSACLCESVADISYATATATTADGLCSVSIIAEPIRSDALVDAIEAGILGSDRADSAPFGRCELSHSGAGTAAGDDAIRAGRIAASLQCDYGYDALAARGFWGLGPHHLTGGNILIDDTLPGDVDANSLARSKDALLQGFRWAVRSGPLCEEPVRGVQFRIVGAVLDPESLLSTPSSLVSACRRACLAAMLQANPRVLEPAMVVEILTPAAGITIIAQLLAQRRGHILSRTPIAASPLHRVLASLPVMDAFGFEVDVRVHTYGQAWCQAAFSHWQVVPGDPLDTSIALSLLEPSPALHLARDFVVKTRRRKGLDERVG